MEQKRSVVMFASENDALKGGKVGGVGDVVRDLPRALADLGWNVTTIIPSYGFLHRDNPSTKLMTIRFPFAGKMSQGDLWEVTPKAPRAGVTHLVFDHPDVGGDPIYFNDPSQQAFARDATKYALFCSAMGQYCSSLDSSTILHLHDWHTGFYFLLQQLHPEFRHLEKFKTIFTIHNLAIQGTRPMQGTTASVEAWFPELFTSKKWISRWKDPRYKDSTFTPMAAGIAYANKVNTVSPTYANEILRPSNPADGFFGGEGLEEYMQQAQKEGRLFGILNGIEYPTDRRAPQRSMMELCDLASAEVKKWNSKKADPFHDDVLKRLETVSTKSPRIILTSITRVVDQKVKLCYETSSRGTTAMEEILSALEERGGIYFFLGNGTTDYEEHLMKSFHAHTSLIFLKGYSDPLAQALYAYGTLFMMPSSFEPCGIGQMLAMRDGQPCVVNAVGGLNDTVIDGVNGFQFSGNTVQEQVDAFIGKAIHAMDIALDDSSRWNQIRQEAMRARFTWESSAKEYIELLYTAR